MVRKSIYYFSIFISIISFLFIFLSQIKNCLLLGGYTPFHISMIFEIRMAFINHSFPSWVNFTSFYNLGQAINGMYPDVTLWPFVLITMWLPFSKQIVVITALIFILTFIVTFYSLVKHNFDKSMAITTAMVYSFSGYCIYQFIIEFQPGTGIIYAFSFPIFFYMKELFVKQSADFKTIIKGTLLFSLILFSHLLSAVVFLLIFFISFILNLTIQKRINYYAIYNVLVSSFLTFIVCLPVIYRLIKIRMSGITEPFGKGNVTAESFNKLFSNLQVISRVSLSAVSLFLLIIILIYSNKTALINELLSIELFIMILCTNIIPWNIIGKIPLLNMLQYTPWRFGIWLSILPLFIFIRMDSNIDVNSKVLVLSIVCILSVANVIGNYKNYMNSPLKFTSNNVTSLNQIKYNPIHNRILIRDYSPKQANKVGINDKVSKRVINQAKSPYIKVDKSKIKVKKQIEANGVKLRMHGFSEKRKILLPVYGYRSLKKEYSITLNDKYEVSEKNITTEDGFLKLNIPNGYYNSLKINSIKISFNNPKIYSILIVLSTFLLSILVVLYFAFD